MSKIKKKPHSTKKIILVISALILLVYIGLALLFKFWPWHKQVLITVPAVKNSLPSSTDLNSKLNSNSSKSSQVDNTNPKEPSQVNINTTTLTAPTGTFVNLYNANADTQMNSICNTTPGANCKIIFTKGSTSIALPAKTTDSSGTATWAWTPKQIGLSNGGWHVVAASAIGSQTKTTDNGSLELVIQ